MHRCNVLFFAAGLGTRLRPFTENDPKPSLPLLKVPLGYYLLPYLENLNIEKFVVNTFHLPIKIHQLYSAQIFESTFKKKIQFSDEKDFIRGSAGGIKYAENLFNKNYPLVVCNSDEVLFTESYDFISKAVEHHMHKKSLATLVVMDHPLAGQQFGAIWLDKEMKVKHIGKTNNGISDLRPKHFVGIQILSPMIIDLIANTTEKNIFYDLLINYLPQVDIYQINCDWYETGDLNSYQNAKNEILNQLQSKNMLYQNHYEKLNRYPKSQLSDLA